MRSYRSVCSAPLFVSVLACVPLVACSSGQPADTSSGATTTAGSVATPTTAGQSGSTPQTPVAGTGGSTQTQTPAANGGAGAPAPAAGAGAAGSGGAPATGAAGMAGAAGAAQAGADGAAGTPATEPSSTDLFIAPGGADTNPGTEEMPLASLAAAVGKASAGMTIWVAAGTYAMTDTVPLSIQGSEEKPIRIWAQSTGERPVFDFKAQPRGDSKARGLAITGDYWHLRGLDVINAGDNCIHVSGAFNKLEWLVTHDCSDTGIQISANSSEADDKTRAANNLVVNCDSYSNYDAQNQGENADGFAAKLYIGPGNVFRGCRAWNNADDGWDLFASDDVVVIEDSWAIANGKIGAAQNNTNGDGNGFKLGGAAQAGDANMGGAPHEVSRCYSIANRACGFVRNNNTQAPRLSMCGGQGDGKGLLCSLDNSGNQAVTMSANDAIMAERDQDGNLPPIR
jgi:pectate disaccharide-lyase